MDPKWSLHFRTEWHIGTDKYRLTQERGGRMRGLAASPRAWCFRWQPRQVTYLNHRWSSRSFAPGQQAMSVIWTVGCRCSRTEPNLCDDVIPTRERTRKKREKKLRELSTRLVETGGKGARGWWSHLKWLNILVQVKRDRALALSRSALLALVSVI